MQLIEQRFELVVGYFVAGRRAGLDVGFHVGFNAGFDWLSHAYARGVAFLHQEWEPQFFFWECCGLWKYLWRLVP